MDLELLDRIPILKNPQHFLGVECILANQNPPVMMIRGLLSQWECQHLIEIAGPKLDYSTMIVNGQEVVNRKARSSRSAFITTNGLLHEDPVIYRLLTRVSGMINVPIDHFEGMKVVNYRKGEEYTPHKDFFGKGTPFTDRIGDRMYTFFIYLNDLEEEEGGATAFPELGIKIRPEAGTAMFWVNIDQNGQYFQQTLHAGEPVVGDREKWGVNIWIRQNSYL
jgi:prolyl 4-hydroxylase